MNDSVAGSERPRIPLGIWGLGLVSMFMDMSSELIHSLLPVFMVTTLGASAVAVGLVEGFAEATASVFKVFSGALSDRLGKRKGLTVFGYGLAAVTKPMFAMATSVSWVFVARFLDRIGKGVRGAPRDALIGEIAPTEIRATCYGLRQSLDTVGALLGGVGAIALMLLLADDIRHVYWFASVPAFVAVAVLVLIVHEPKRSASVKTDPVTSGLADMRRLGSAYWFVVVVGSVLMLARFSEAFLVLRAEEQGLGIAFVPLVLIIMSAVYALSAYPVGVLADRVGRRSLLVPGFLTLILADLALSVSRGVPVVLVGVGLWGLHMGFTQGLLSTLVADASPTELRGTAFGVFNLVNGFVLLAASVGAGFLWSAYGPPAPFMVGAAVSAAGLAMFLFTPRTP